MANDTAMSLLDYVNRDGLGVWVIRRGDDYFKVSVTSTPVLVDGGWCYDNLWATNKWFEGDSNWHMISVDRELYSEDHGTGDYFSTREECMQDIHEMIECTVWEYLI